MKTKLLLIWSYLGEIILTTAVFGLSINIFGKDEVLGLLKSIAEDLLVVLGMLFAGSLAFLWTFYSRSETDFSKWLYEKGAYKVYLRAYVTAILIYFLSCVALLIYKSVSYEPFALCVLWLTILALLNVYSFFRNVVGQLMLNMEFNKINRK